MKIMVLGAGVMGAGIAQIAAQSGFTVLLRDIESAFCNRGQANIAKNLDKLTEKGKITAEERAETLARITTTTDIGAARDVDLVIEAALENLEIKKKIFQELDSICPPATILATNTSALSITEIAAATKRPGQVLGMHFFNPVPAMKLVEVIRATQTSDEAFKKIFDLCIQMGKTPVEITEAPGFVVNRLLVPMINEAIYILMEGVAAPADIDESMKLGASHPMGPLALADLIGLDICLAIMQTLHREFGDDKYRPCPLLTKMVRAGKLGRKTGEGFFSY
jgi:3-hydroxybutyryl-CoA dehydrogenase